MEGHQLHPKTMECPTSPADDRTPTMTDQRLAVAGGEEDHQPHSKKVGAQTMPDTQLSSSNQGMMMVQLQASLNLSSTQMTLLEGSSHYPLETMERDQGQKKRQMVTLSKNPATSLVLVMEK